MGVLVGRKAVPEEGDGNKNGEVDAKLEALLRDEDAVVAGFVFGDMAISGTTYDGDSDEEANPL